jgi:FlaG/FlaF family flagellin (archaellin)
MQMKFQNERAVSPVVGVMLMLIVVVIIAAVVSGFSSSLVGGENQKVPQLSMDVNIVNGGYWSTSYFKAVVTGVDNPIKTKDLKIVTSWSKTFSNGSVIKGGTTVTPGVRNFNVIYDTHGGGAYDLWQTVVPQGYGPGVGQSGTEFPNFWPVEGSHGLITCLDTGACTNYTWYGNYNLQAGTIMFARPFGGKLGGQSAGSGSFGVGYGITPNLTADPANYGGGRYTYAYGTSGTVTCVLGTSAKCNGAQFYPYPTTADQDPATYSVDQMQAVLGNNWNQLRAGDIVTMKVIHIPSGKIIWQKDISVEG